MVSEEFMDEIIDSEMEQREQMEMIECLGRANVKIIELEAKLSFAVEVLEKYVDVSLYLGTYPEQYVAKEALEKLRGPNE